MIRRRITGVLIASVAGAAAVLLLAAPAGAVTAAQKLSQLSAFTQIGSTSYNAWNAARQNQATWVDYGFDWSTDYCSTSPDQPLGFDFRLSCHRHDFGYRNYKAMGQFDANKSRLDDMFYNDLKAKCSTYNVFVRPACYSLAWSYYQAVKGFGAPSLSPGELNRATQLRNQGLAAARA